jgi:hypothetical protein
MRRVIRLKLFTYDTRPKTLRCPKDQDGDDWGGCKVEMNTFATQHGQDNRKRERMDDADNGQDEYHQSAYCRA